MPWSPARRFAFRAGFCYVALYLPFLASVLVESTVYEVTGRFPASPVTEVQYGLVSWFMNRVVHVRSICDPNRAGTDAPCDWMLLVASVVAAAVAASVWNALDRKRSNDERLYAWLRFAVRYVLAGVLLFYGVDKLFTLQFGTLTPDRYVRPFGDLAPAALLWNFMAASPGYTMFTGAVETAAAVLLAFRRFVTLGAIVATIAMTNVLALNVFYGVQVKLLSAHLLVLAAFLALPDIPRLFDLLATNRTPRAATAEATLASNVRVDRLVRRSATILACIVLVADVMGAYVRFEVRSARLADRGPLYGVWRVDRFDVREGAHPTGIAGDGRWARLAFAGSGLLAIDSENDDLEFKDVAIDPVGRTIDMTDRRDPRWHAGFAYVMPTPRTLVLSGTVGDGAVRATLHRSDVPASSIVRYRPALVEGDR